jgi:hypothetical protein
MRSCMTKARYRLRGVVWQSAPGVSMTQITCSWSDKLDGNVLAAVSVDLAAGLVPRMFPCSTDSLYPERTVATSDDSDRTVGSMNG